MNKILCFFLNHKWHYWGGAGFSSVNPGLKITTSNRTCDRCGKTQQEVWNDFSSFYWV